MSRAPGANGRRPTDGSASLLVSPVRRTGNDAPIANAGPPGGPHRHLRVLTDELRKRVGSTFTLRELADEYGRADDWARDAVAERATHPGWLSSFAIVEGAAFHLYSRGAVDYEP